METKILKIKNFYYRYRKYILINFAIVSLILMVCLIAYFLRSKQDKTIYYNVASSKIDSFDPQKAVFNQDTVYNIRFYNLIHEGLTKKVINNDNKPIFICNLVEDDPVLLSNNGYEFKLKPNIKFHNGKILKPSDVKFTIQRNHVKHQENGKPSCSVFKKFDMTNSVFDNENNTMKIYYQKEYSAELDMLKDLAFVKILNEEACSKYYLEGAKIGLGHYKIKTFSDKENNILLDKFVDFFDTTHSNEFPENIRVRLFESNQIDTMIEEIENNQIHALLDCPSDKIQKVTDKTNIESESNVKPFSLSVLWFNCAKIKPEVRKLIAQTINTKKMVEEISQDDKTVKLDEYLFPNSFIYNEKLIGYDEQQQNTPYYIENTKEIEQKVKQLNSEDKKIIFATFKPSEGSFRSRFLHKIKDSLDAVGFEVDFTYKASFEELSAECRNNQNNCKAVLFGESLDDTDPSPCFAYYSIGSEYKSLFNFENNNFLKIFDTLLTVNIPDGFPNLTQKTDKIKELNKILKDEIPCLPLIANKNNYTLYNKTNAKFKALRDILSH